MSDKRPNRLIHEKSPYLLQHAYNPVDWYPWSEEAFKKAKEEDKTQAFGIRVKNGQETFKLILPVFRLSELMGVRI